VGLHGQSLRRQPGFPDHVSDALRGRMAVISELAALKRRTTSWCA